LSASSSATWASRTATSGCSCHRRRRRRRGRARSRRRPARERRRREGGRHPADEGRLRVRRHPARRHRADRAGRHAGEAVAVEERVKVGGLRQLEHVGVEEELKLAGADRRELAEHDVLRDALHQVRLGEAGRLHQHVDRLLERAAREGAVVDAVDSVARDREQVAAVRHHVAQDGQVAVVDVRAVKLDHRAQLAEQRLPHRLDPEVADDLANVVRHEPRVVDPPVGRRDRREVDPLRVEHPLGHHAERARHRVDVLALRLAHEDALDLLDAAQRHLGEHVLLDALQEGVLDVLVPLRLRLLVRLAVDEPHAQHQPVVVVLRVDDVQLVAAVLGGDALHDVLHQQVLVRHRLHVELDAQHPRRDL